MKETEGPGPHGADILEGEWMCKNTGIFVTADHWPSAHPILLGLQDPSQRLPPCDGLPGMTVFTKLLQCWLSLTALSNCKLFYTQHYSFIVILLKFHEAIKFSFLPFMFPTAQKPELALGYLLINWRQGVILPKSGMGTCEATEPPW